MTGGFVADFLIEVSDVIKRHQVDSSIADKIIADIRKSFGGGFIYVKKDKVSKTEKRHAEIKRRFTGNNHWDLAREFDVGMSQIYRVLKS
jgi:Mor family transcriptional regulator